MNTLLTADNGIVQWFMRLGQEYYDAFIKEDRYLFYLDGLKTTLLISLLAIIIGSIIGVTIAITKVYVNNIKGFRWIGTLCNIYINIIRGTPVMLQLLIIYNLIFTSRNTNEILVAAICFGINSGAYVAEIVRAGIESVDKGQMEAGLSLGLNSSKTMLFIIMPQAIKNILPALGNEFIALLKETSVVGFVPVIDLTNAGNLVRSRTYLPFFSLYTVALGYLIMVLGLGSMQKRLERRLSQSDRN